MKTKSKKKSWVYAVGRRRKASARVRLHKGGGDHLVNDLPIGKYFPGEANRVKWEKPFKLTETSGKYFITAKIVGGGLKGQLDALVHAISRVLTKLNQEKYKAPLKSAGLLTRDARVRERRKVGTGGKARRKKQSPKR